MLVMSLDNQNPVELREYHQPRSQPQQIQWATEQQVAESVELLQPRTNLAAWSAWVERVGGTWATKDDLARI